MARPYHAVSHKMGLRLYGELEEEKVDLFQPLRSQM